MGTHGRGLSVFDSLSLTKPTFATKFASFDIESVSDLLALARRIEHSKPSNTNCPAVAIRESFSQGHDFFGESYCRLRSAEQRRSFGITLTPSPIVRAMTGWVLQQASQHGAPARIVDPGAGTGRFAIAAALAFPHAHIVAIEPNAEMATLLRANIAAMRLAKRCEVIESDFREVELPMIAGATAYIGNPPYVRHHDIARRWKDWYAKRCQSYGIRASRLAGLHLHFFAKVADLARFGDYGCFITAAEWLDVNYGAALRTLLTRNLDVREIHILSPTAQAFPGTMSTAAITGFTVGRRSSGIRFHQVETLAELTNLSGGRHVSWSKVAECSRWSSLTREGKMRSAGQIELGELCRVHRGQVTGSNRIWIAGDQARTLPRNVLRATITSAEDIIEAAPILDRDRHLARVIDLPQDLESLGEGRDAVDRFLRWARSMGAADGYVARHRAPWWAVRLKDPAPIVCTYMARRPPVFAINAVGARLLNIAHGLYPRDPLSSENLSRLTTLLNRAIHPESGRIYAGGLVKFEPRELERTLIPRIENWDG